MVAVMSELESRPDANDSRDRDRAIEYLRTLCIDDAEADETIRWAIQLATSEGRDPSSTLSAVMFAVDRRIEQWHDRFGGDSSMAEFKAIILPKLRRLLAVDAMLLCDADGEALRNTLGDAIQVLQPHTPGQTMPRQAFGKAPPPLRPGFWWRVARRGAMWGRGVTNMLRSR